MTKRRPSAPPASRTAQTTSSGTPTTDRLEQRVVAFAEQLGRIVGSVQARTAGWMDADALKKELARVRDGAAELLDQLTADAPPVSSPRSRGPATGRTRGRSGGIVDAPGKKHRPPVQTDPAATRADSQAAKLRDARTMVKTSRLRGRG